MKSIKMRKVNFKKLPSGIWLLEKAGLCCTRAKSTRTSYRTLVFLLTYAIYAHYTLSRKPFGVSKVVLCPQCTADGNNSYGDFGYENSTNNSSEGWPPFNGPNGRTLLGSVDYSLLFAYAVGNFISGQIADRVNVRYFLTIAMLGISLVSGVMGLGYFLQVHHLAFFIVVQVVHGFLQSTGWSAVSGIMAVWFGKKNRGIIIGLWSSCALVGNITGNILASFWVQSEEVADSPWGWSFLVPSFMLAGLAVIVFLFLVPDPTHVGLRAEVQNLRSDDGFFDKTKSANLTSTREDRNNKEKEHGVTRPSASNPLSLELYEGGESELCTLAEDGLNKGENPVANAAVVETQICVVAKHEHDKFVDPKVCEIAKNELSEGEIPGRNSSVVTTCEVTEGEPPGLNEGVESNSEKIKAINFFRAFLIPGVVEYSIAFFFIKLVAFSFFFWLPFYVKTSLPELGGKEAAWLATLFDAGGIFGAVLIGFISDRLGSRSLTCVTLLALAIPLMFVLRIFGGLSVGLYAVLLFASGVAINGPYGLISGAVSNDLGTHKSLKSNQRAMSTVSGIINGIGSLGAATGPLLIGVITDHLGWDSAFYCLMICCFVAALSLCRLVTIDFVRLCKRIKSTCTRHSKNKDSVVSSSVDEKDETRGSDEDDIPCDQDVPGGVYFVTAL